MRGCAGVDSSSQSSINCFAVSLSRLSLTHAMHERRNRQPANTINTRLRCVFVCVIVQWFVVGCAFGIPTPKLHARAICVCISKELE